MIYVTGDTHSDFERLSSRRLKFMKADDVLLICGDFGFVWDGSKKERKILTDLGKRPYNICFIDGAHDNMNLISKYPESTWHGGKVNKISGNLLYLRRGEIFEIERNKLLAFGGGELSDNEKKFLNTEKDMHTMPTKNELEDIIVHLNNTGYDVDIVITHEPPAKIKQFLLLNNNEPFTSSALGVPF